MKTVHFVVSDHGMGHITRCLALAEELGRRGWEVVERDEADVVVVDIQRQEPPHVQVTHSLGRCGSVLIVDTPRETGPFDLVICGSAGAVPEMFMVPAQTVLLAGPEYALLRPEFAGVRWQGGKPAVDIREMTGLSARQMADLFAEVNGVLTYAGMRAMEARCVGVPLVMIARNPGEELNKRGLEAGARVDGKGCVRVVDVIEELFS